MIAAPLFHSWGFAHFTLALGLARRSCSSAGSTPRPRSRQAARHRCTALVVVPVMIQRILELDDEVLRRYDLSSLQRRPGLGLGAAGRDVRALDGPVRRQPLQPLRLDRGRLGDDRDARPTCAPRPAPPAARRAARSCGCSTTTAARSRPARAGASSSATTSRSRATRAAAARSRSTGLLSSGDVGHFDAAGRLFVDGRDDDMIVSGGENVFPAEVEDLLAGHDGGRRGGGVRRRRRAVRPAAQGGRRDTAGQGAERGRREALRQVEPRRATRSRATSSSSTSCRARRPARCSSGSCEETPTQG